MDRYSQRMERADLRGGVFLLAIKVLAAKSPEKQIIDISSDLQSQALFAPFLSVLPLFAASVGVLCLQW